MPPFIPRMLSPRQRQLVCTIEQLTRERGFPPSMKEVAAVMNVHTSRISQLAAETAWKGAITRTPGCSRSWRVVAPASSSRK